MNVVNVDHSMNAHLFLAHTDDHQPVLQHGAPVGLTQHVPALETPRLPQERLANLFGPPDDLREQRWAILAPQGLEGDKLLSLIQPLRTKREEEQGREALVYRIAPNMDQISAVEWIKNEYRNLVNRKEAARPRYLLLLGGPEAISWDLQQLLAGETFVGRIAFDHDAGYEAYVEKAVRCADARLSSHAQALFHTVFDGTKATSEGHEGLMQPLLALVRDVMDDKFFDAESLRNTAMKSPTTPLDLSSATNALLEQASRSPTSLLFSMSHGAGIPKEGWSSVAEQRAMQGAMVLGNGQLLRGSDIRDKPFLPWGVWFMFACYGAGMPSRSAYLPWLRELASRGVPTMAIDTLLRALPGPNEKPFVAALPQAALANPQGPLAIVAHVDLAWSWSFLEYVVESSGPHAVSRAERFQSMLRAFLHGHRVGVAHHELVHFFRAANTELTAIYNEEALATRPPRTAREETLHQVRKLNLWMQRQDLGAHVLLGDPAARLPIAQLPPGIRQASRSLLSNDHVIQREQDVLAVLRGIASPEEIAKQRGVSQIEVERWSGVFVEGGRLALADDF